jgi:S-adenosylmethionine:tRNA ribosyltransferase-isomerase
MRVDDFDYDLPPELIAQQPPAARGASRLMVLDRATGATACTTIAALPELLREGDVLVVNDTRVFPARLIGHRVPSGGLVECLLLERLDADRWDALVHPGQKLKPGARLAFGEGAARLEGEVVGRGSYGRRTVRLVAAGGGEVDAAIDAIGHVPLPPYIKRPDEASDHDRYQTVFARVRGSVAAPTAGLHFTPALLDALAARGVERVAVTLHVGYGTFKPVRAQLVEEHRVDAEPFEIAPPAAARINAALDEGRRVVAVGTTVKRALETAAREDGRLRPGRARTELFIHPWFEFRVLSGLLTNFHVPRSSLLMLVAAFAGRERVLQAYRAAVAERFRFYSYGDGMLIIAR